MIVRMRKLYVASRRQQRDQLLDALRDAGMVHLVPVQPQRAVADEQTLTQLGALERAAQVLAAIPPAGPRPEIAARAAAEEVLDIQRRRAEGDHRLTALQRQLTEVARWGDLSLSAVAALRAHGLPVRVFTVPAERVGEIEAECAAVVGEPRGGRALVAVVQRAGEPRIPDDGEEQELPPRDAASLRAEAADVDGQLRRDAARLGELAHLRAAIEAEALQLHEQVDFAVALRGAADAEHLFAVQGWIPAKQVPELPARLAAAGVDAATQALEPAPDDQPPTLIRNPRWMRPIDGLFKVLGTVPGYREFDVSLPFLIALPIFAAILICDGGYGALLLLGLVLGYKRVAPLLGRDFTQLLIIVGAATLVWGGLTATFFGFTLYRPVIPADLSDESRVLLMRMSFLFGAIHLSLAQLWQAQALAPDLRFLSKVGWATFLWGMLGVVQMFVLSDPLHWGTPWPYLLIVGATLAITFAQPRRNVALMLLLGIAAFPLSLLSAFSDVISYVRLMAVGLASSVLAATFNDMALGLGFWPLTIVVLLIGHALTFALGVIALFAHGVRLNMLEFSSNLGMQWTGYPFSPFRKRLVQEA